MFKMVKRTSQEHLKVVILRDFGLSWENIREKTNKSTAQTIFENYLKNGSADDAKRNCVGIANETRGNKRMV